MYFYTDVYCYFFLAGEIDGKLPLRASTLTLVYIT